MAKRKVKNSDEVNNEKKNFRVVNRYPDDNLKNTKDAEKKLYEVFRKYEND